MQQQQQKNRAKYHTIVSVTWHAHNAVALEKECNEVNQADSLNVVKTKKYHCNMMPNHSGFETQQKKIDTHTHTLTT